MKKINSFSRMLEDYFNPIEKIYYSNISNKLISRDNIYRNKFLDKNDKHWYFYIGCVQQVNLILEAIKNNTPLFFKKVKPMSTWNGSRFTFPIPEWVFYSPEKNKIEVITYEKEFIKKNRTTYYFIGKL